MQLRIALGIGHACPERLDRGVDLAFLADRGDSHGDFPDVGFGLEMLAPVTLDGHAPDEIPCHELPDRGRNVRSREPEHGGDVLGRARPFREIKQRMNLAYRAVDAPLPAHVAPMQHEALGRAGELNGLFRNFCHYRNIGNFRKKVKGTPGRGKIAHSAPQGSPKSDISDFGCEGPPRKRGEGWSPRRCRSANDFTASAAGSAYIVR